MKRAVDVLSLGAAPAFAGMALLTHVQSEPMHCASPWTGMVTMYLLMSFFHLGPWLHLGHHSSAGGQHVQAR